MQRPPAGYTPCFHRVCYVLLMFLPLTVQASALRLGTRLEIPHTGAGHDLHVSGPAVATARDGSIFVAWSAQQAQRNQLYLARPTAPDVPIVRIDPAELEVDALHQAPGIALGPKDEVYVSWSSSKTKPEGVLFASDLRLSRSLDGGRSFEAPLRVNEDRPLSHSFEGLAVAADGTVFVAWIDSREDGHRAGTYLTRITQRGTRVEPARLLDSDTCVCCRVGLRSAPPQTVAAIWRKVFPGNLRDMVLGLSRDGGRTFTTPVLVHDDHWQITACPHRGGSVGLDGQQRLYVSWYTEGANEQPGLFVAVSTDGQHFSPPQRLDHSTASIPDHPRMAVDAAGRMAVVWEDATAVRRRVLLRYSTDGGSTLSPIHSLSQAIKAYAPDITVGPTGEFVAVWHEEHFPALKTVVQPLWFDTQP
ncbi:MAG: sialidase family protein [Candidatus Tectimicrobiota bacterium]